MQPLPTIPTVSSPFFPSLTTQPFSPDVTQPELSWGTDVTASYPSFLASPTGVSLQQQVDVWSPTSDLPTADILAAYDEFTATPVQAEPENPNHPYVPWTPNFRLRYITRREDRSPLSPSTNLASRPTSRSGAVAPEPPASPEVPHCGPRVAGSWCRFAGRLKRELNAPKSRARSQLSRKVLKKRRTGAKPALAGALRQTAHVLMLGTSVSARPSNFPSLPVIGVDASPIAPSFASAGTEALDNWLAARRLSASCPLEDAENAVPLDEYERRGSWLYSLQEQCERDHNASLIHVIDVDEQARRQDAIREGWACGFVGCDMHPRPEHTHSTFFIDPEAESTIVHGIAH
jgi:hypothetical protein